MNKTQSTAVQTAAAPQARRPYEAPTFSEVPLDKIVYAGGASGPDPITTRQAG